MVFGVKGCCVRNLKLVSEQSLDPIRFSIMAALIRSVYLNPKMHCLYVEPPNTSYSCPPALNYGYSNMEHFKTKSILVYGCIFK